MSLKYVLSTMRRRKLRTAIIALALTIGVALVGALLALVDTQRQFSTQSLGAQTGGYDLSISKSDLASTPLFDISAVASTTREAYSGVSATYARIQTSVEGRAADALEGQSVTVVALDTLSDTLVSSSQGATASTGTSFRLFGLRIGGGGGGPGGGPPPPGGGGGPPPGGGGPPPSGGSSSSSSSSSSAVSAQSAGSYPPAAGQVFLSNATAGALGVSVGDEIQLTYAVPAQREEGKSAVSGVSTPRIEARFIVAGIGTIEGLSSSTSNPVIMNLSDAQTWLNASDQANQLLLVWQSRNASTTNAKSTVTQARDVGETVRDALQAQLGSEYTVSLPKYTSLESSSQSYAFTQTFITLYGMLSMGIIGLMVNALMTTTVAEQKFDLAVLRVLGAPRTRLFSVVILEVFLLGVVGIVFGLLLGRLINDQIMVPLILANLDLPSGVRAEWTLQSVLIPTGITLAVLTLATINPARTAAATKVMVVLNPAAADQPTLDDLARLRERRADSGLLIAGFVLVAFSAVILILLPTIFTSGNQTGQVWLQFGSLLLMVIGISLLFYFITTPLERVLVALYQLISPKAGFFAGRYALRGKGRNALISLMVVMSGVLPCLLATQLALQDANIETDTRFSNGAPITASRGSTASGGFPVFRRVVRTDVNLTDADVAAVTEQPGIGTVVGIADNLPSMTVSDRIGLRSSTVSLVGVDGDLTQVLYSNLFRWSEGNISALPRLASEDNAVIISQGLSEALDLHLGDTLIVKGNGTDHQREMTIIGVASRIPGFSSYFTRNSSDASRSGVLMSMVAYRDLQDDPSDGPADADADVLTKLMATTATGVDESALLSALRKYLGSATSLTVTATSESVTQSRTQLQQTRIFIVLLTALSMLTAIFGVLAVMYTAVMGRRIEIGMLKAVGASKGALRGVFIGEAVITTLAAGISGIVAGTLLGYAFEGSQRLQNDRIFLLAFDFRTATLIVALVCVSAVISAAMATQPVIRQKAITILRER